jgi:hypothetical protein
LASFWKYMRCLSSQDLGETLVSNGWAGGDREAKHSARCQTDLPNMSVDWCWDNYTRTSFLGLALPGPELACSLEWMRVTQREKKREPALSWIQSTFFNQNFIKKLVFFFLHLSSSLVCLSWFLPLR